MKNNKGFTLVELLAVIVILGVLLLLAIPAVTRQLENARKKTFIEDANTVIKAVKNDLFMSNRDLSESATISYDIVAINKLLDKKLVNSPLGGQYSTANVFISMQKNASDELDPIFYLCLIDGDNNGFDYTKSSELDPNKIKLNSVRRCSQIGPDGIIDSSTVVVTANANNGSIPNTKQWFGTGSTATKTVDVDAPYGNLPIPGRSGYVFVGWYESLSMYSVKLTLTDNTITLLLKNGNGNPVSEAVIDDSEWTVFEGITDSNGILTETFDEAAEWFDLASYLSITIEGTTYTVSGVTGTGRQTDVTTQFQVGSSKITESTVVSKNSDHTIYALWNRSLR